jgi:hypothetical protein
MRQAGHPNVCYEQIGAPPVVDIQSGASAVSLFLTNHLQQNFTALLGMDDRSTDFLESVFRRDGN